MLHGEGVLRVMARPRRQPPEPRRLECPAHRRLADDDAELLEDPLRQVPQPPAHHPVDGWDRTAVHERHQRPALFLGQFRLAPGALRSISPLGPSALKRNTQSRMT